MQCISFGNNLNDAAQSAPVTSAVDEDQIERVREVEAQAAAAAPPPPPPLRIKEKLKKKWKRKKVPTRNGNNKIWRSRELEGGVGSRESGVGLGAAAVAGTEG
ncbi:hypothetical protein K0M31_004362 [Melipona bicolor]|uniref:Uncharacterized protein n=1 Tax=Melipona bicolor TaxID=60889 RepID=A0AA40KN81_9HYME|nr:hypothetical protein K0M31_004362 [Melipona bicolor]